MSFHSTHANASNVAHNWANQLPTKFKKDTEAGSLFFIGKTIYSFGHHFPIATIHINNEGVKTVLFTTRSYSNTTSRHKAIVSQACSQFNKVYCYDPGSAANSYGHKANLLEFEKAAKDIVLTKLPRSNKPAMYLNEIEGYKAQAIAYAEYFNLLKKPKFKSLHFIHVVTKEGAQIASAKDLKARAIEQKRVEAARILRHKEELIKHGEEVVKFKAFAVDRVYSDASGHSYLRFNADTQRVETSQKVEIPVKVAKIAFKWIINTIASGGCIGDCKFKVMEFEVLEANNEFVRIGCHKIELSEINALATQLEWI